MEDYKGKHEAQLTWMKEGDKGDLARAVCSKENEIETVSDDCAIDGNRKCQQTELKNIRTSRRTTNKTFDEV